MAETGFDPAEISDLYSSNLIANIFDTPLTYDYLARPLKLVPNTLEAMPEITEGGTLYTMRVKPGIYFADDAAFKGKRRELVAEDFVYSIKRLFDPKKKSPNLYQFEGQIAGMDEVLAARAEGEPHGLRRARRGPARARPLHLAGAPQAAQLQLPLLPRLLQPHLRRGARGGRALRRAHRRASRGHRALPAAFWKRSSKMVFEANPGYREEFYDEEPAADDAGAQAIAARLTGKRLPMVGRVEVYIVEEPQPRWLAFLNGEHDFVERVPNEFANVATPNNELAANLRRRGIQMERTPGMELTYSYFAMKDPVVGGYEPEKVALRRAIVLGQDVGDGDPHPAQEPGDSRAEPHRPGRHGLRPRLPLHGDRVQPGQGEGAARHVRLRRLRRRRLARPAAEQRRRRSASPSASSTPRRRAATRSRSTRTGRRTWTPSAST